MRIVHSHRPENLDAVAAAELSHDLQWIRPLPNEILGLVVRESFRSAGEDLADLGIVREHAEARTPGTIDNGVDLSSDKIGGAAVQERFGCSFLEEVHGLVAIVIHDDSAFAMGGLLPCTFNRLLR